MWHPSRAIFPAVTLFLAALLWPAAGPVPAQAEEGVVATFSGQSNVTTEPFGVAGPWIIVWRTEARRFQVTAIGHSSGIPSIIVSRPGDGQGREQMIRSGTFQLEIVADGPWEVDIVGRAAEPS